MARQPSPYASLFARSLAEPEAFWEEAATELVWSRPHDRVLDDHRPPFYRWYPGGELNTCFNALDRHVDEGHGARLALVYDSPLTGTVLRFTYAELLDEVARFAGALRDLGVEKGDRVLIYMPMVPEAVVGMLACARLGAVHSVVFGGFASKELATRIDDAKPQVILTASCGIEPTLSSSRSGITTGTSFPKPRPPFRRWMSKPRILSTSSTHRVRRESPRGSFETTAVTPWRCGGVSKTSTGWAQGMSSGPHRISVGSWGTPTSSTRRCSSGVRRFSTRGNRWGHRMRELSGGSSRITA